MSYLTSQIIPTLQTIKLLSNVNEFKKWMQKKHPDKNSPKIFMGYRFLLNCCLNSFIEDISNDSELKIKNDFLLDRAISQGIHIRFLPNSCEKIIFLKNISPIIKGILRAKNYDAISIELNKFNVSIISKFDMIFENCISISPKVGVTKETALNLLLIDYAHTYLIQINNNGPAANMLNVLATERTNEKFKNICFEGYKYAVQFLWFKLLGEEKFKKIHLSEIHLADSWNNYNDTEEEQTSLDSYFYWIQKEITRPISKLYKISVYSIGLYFKFIPKKYNKNQLFGELLDSSKIKYKPVLNWTRKIEECLYWHPLEIVDTEKSRMFMGISAFNTMLAGLVALHKPQKSQFSKIFVVKFIHPHSDDKNDYSYGILVDTKSVAGHYASGWIIYQNACGDYSGFSGGQHMRAEKLIKKYKKAKKIKLIRLTIPLEEFQKFTKQHILNYDQRNILEENKLITDFFQKSKAYLLELFTYHLCIKYYQVQGFTITLNAGKKSKEGEKDVVLINEENDQVIVIECKLNPQNNDMEDMLAKMESKLDIYPQEKKSCQFWFWHKPSPQDERILNKAKVHGTSVEVIVLSSPKGEKILKGVDMKSMKTIMQDYKKQSNIPEYTIEKV